VLEGVAVIVFVADAVTLELGVAVFDFVGFGVDDIDGVTV
jgi:hypothetical protein